MTRRRHNDGSVSELQMWLSEMFCGRNMHDAHHVATSLLAHCVGDDAQRLLPTWHVQKYKGT